MTVMSTLDGVRHYSATDEMNGRVNAGLNLGSDSDEDLPGPGNRIRKISKASVPANDSPSHRPMIVNRKVSLSKIEQQSTAGHGLAYGRAAADKTTPL